MERTRGSFTNSELDEINATLREYLRNAGLDAYAKSGKLILERFFDGNVSAWESRAPQKAQSIRRLAERPGAPYGKDALSRRVGVYIALRRHDFVYRCEGLSARHVFEVLRLPADVQATMLRRAADERWSARELRKRVIENRRAEGERRGAPLKDPGKKAAARLERSVRALEEVGELLGQAVHDENARLNIKARLADLSRLIACIREGLDGRVQSEGVGPRLAKTNGQTSILAVDISS